MNAAQYPTLEPLPRDAFGPEPRESSPARGNLQGLSRLLRIAGAAVLMVAASVFLFQQWEAGNDLARYASLVGMTVLLSIAGFLCGSKIGENKSARTLLGLVLSVLPVHFAVLAGFVYSQISWDGLPILVPAFAVWTASSPLAAVALALAATALLLPIAYLSFLTLARARAKQLTLLFGLFNLALLLPLRSPQVVAFLVAVQAGVLIWHELRQVPRQTAMRTPEGRFCRLLLVVPPMVMAGRSLMYEPSLALGGLLILALAFAVHRLAARWTGNEDVQLVMRTSAALAGCVGWLAIAGSIFGGVNLTTPWMLPLAALPCSVLLLGAAAYGGDEAKLLRYLALAGAVLAIGVNLMVFPSVGSALLALTVGISVLGYGYWVGSLLLIGLAAVLSALGLWVEMRLAVELFGIGRWGALALLGLGIILAAAVLERHGERLRAALPRAAAKFGV